MSTRWRKRRKLFCCLFYSSGYSFNFHHSCFVQCRHLLLTCLLTVTWCVVYAVIGAELSDAQQDTHLVLEYETNDVCGNYTAPRANRSLISPHSLLTYTAPRANRSLIIPHSLLTLLHEPTGLSSSRTHCLHCSMSQQVSHPTLIAYTVAQANRSLIPHSLLTLLRKPTGLSSSCTHCLHCSTRSRTHCFSKTQSQVCISALFLLLSKKLIFITYCSVCYNILKLGL